MAICCRSTRDLSIVTNTTPAKVSKQDCKLSCGGVYSAVVKVGPGCYDFKSSSKILALSAPPFQSASLRRPFDDSRKNPGPGDYFLKDEISPLSTFLRQQGGQYNSRCSRFAVEHSESPGPNVYSLPDGWLKKTFNRKPREDLSTSYLERLKTSVPSIPVREQCAGYKQTESGELCLEQIEDTMSDNEISTQGGCYPGLEIYSKAKTMASFGNCKTKRELFNPSKNPGPGYYSLPSNRSASILSEHLPKDDHRTANFKSSTLLSYQTDGKSSGQIPGPGAYLRETQDEESDTTVPFGSSQKRCEENAGSLSAPSSFTLPGPGSYTLLSNFDPKQPNFIAKSRPAFCQSSKRFENYETLPPGPGEYETLSGLMKRSKYKHKMKGGFLSCDQRSASWNCSLTSGCPGPGQYRQSSSWHLEDGHKTKNNSFMFASKEKRFLDPKGPTQPEFAETRQSSGIVKGDPGRLGPGTYNIREDEFSLRAARRSLERAPFLCSDTRFRKKHFRGDEKLPGPAEYKTSKGLIDRGRCPQNVYFSTQPRFRNDVFTYLGPGCYQSTQDSMIKKSFNNDGYSMTLRQCQRLYECVFVMHKSHKGFTENRAVHFDTFNILFSVSKALRLLGFRYKNVFGQRVALCKPRTPCFEDPQ